MTEEQINQVTTHILNGLNTDGGHHKQYELEMALVALRGQEWVDQHKKDIEEEGVYCVWDEGIP